jgi:hypothetical protein
VLALAEAADVELVVQGQALDAFIHVRNQAFIQLVQGKFLLRNKYFTSTIKFFLRNYLVLMKEPAEGLKRSRTRNSPGFDPSILPNSKI